MNIPKLNYKILVIGLLIGLFATASTGFACWGNRMGHHGSGPAHGKMAITPQQQNQLDAVQEKYAADLEELHSALDQKAADYRQARADEDTTVGTLKRLDAEMADLESQYASLLEQANAEARQVAGAGLGPWFGCNYNNCAYHNHGSDSHVGRMMGPDHRDQHMAGRMACGW